MNEIETIKTINFDLDTNMMLACLGSKTDGYNILRRELEQFGFKHRQGSGYVSEIKICFSDVKDILIDISQRQDWLGKCVNKFDVAIAGENFDFRYVFDDKTERIPFILFPETKGANKANYIEKSETLLESELYAEENETEMQL